MNYYRTADTGFTTPLTEISEAGDYVARFKGVNNYAGERIANIKLTDAVRMSTLKASGYAKTVSYAEGRPEGVQAPDVSELKITNGGQVVPSDCYTVSFKELFQPLHGSSAAHSHCCWTESYHFGYLIGAFFVVILLNNYY